MKTLLICLVGLFIFFTSAVSAQMVISGVVDGPLSGGTPKAVEFYVYEDIADLSAWGFGSANNGGGSDGEEFTFPAVSATAGTFLYVASESPQFTAFFGFAPDYVSGATSINGDDAIELFYSSSVFDVFGDINTDGSGQPWEYMDGWAYRNNDTGPDGSTFVLGNWSFSGPNALDGETTNSTAATPFPIGTYSRSTPSPGAVINEFVFNHTGTDDHEFIEIFSTPSTDLSSLTIVVIDGSDGIITNTYPVGSTDADGFWVTPFLIDELGNETQSLFLVYNFSGAVSDDLDTDNDGVFDITPWAELVDDIGVSGDVGTLNYASVTLTQGFDGGIFTVGGASRIPNGTDTDSINDWERNDFDGEGLDGFIGSLVEGEAVNTPGAVNSAWEPPPPPIADFIINEVDADQTGTDTDEFIEIFDGGIGNLPLDGLVVVLFNGATDLSYAAYDLDGYSTDAEGFFVIGCATVPNVDLVFPASDNNIQNGADAVALYQGNDFDFPNGTGVTTSFIIDALVYGTDDADDPELLDLLNPGQSQINENGAGNKDLHSNQRYPNGAGGQRNTDTYYQFEPTPGELNFPQAPPIVINEVDADQAGTDASEFIELYVQPAGKSVTSLNGLVIVLYNGSDDESYAVYSLDGFSTDENGYFVIGSADVPNVDFVAFTTNGIQNGADAVALYHGSIDNYPLDLPVTTDNLIDAIVYGTSDDDDEGLLVLLNPGEPQVDENGNGSSRNHSSQRYPNGSGGALNTSTYAQFYPTPGSVNVFPVAGIDVESLEENLNPNFTASQTITLSNNGEGPLHFNVAIEDNSSKSVNGENNTNATLDYWLSVNPSEGTILPDAKGTQQLEVTFNTTDLPLGIYEAEIHILSNDAVNDDFEIPVMLNVGANLEGTFVYVNGKSVIGLDIIFTDTDKNEISATTDEDGYFNIPVLLPGEYSIELSGGLDADPNAISTVDALVAHKMAQKIIPIPDIRSPEFKAADVSKDGWISYTDAILIFDYLFGLLDGFPRDQWIVEDGLENLLVTNQEGIDLGINRVVLTGDVDLSYRRGSTSNNTISLSLIENERLPLTDKIAVPVYAGNDINLGASVINLGFDSEKFEVEFVKSDLPNFRYQVNNDQIVITSFMEENSVKLLQGDELFNVSMVKTTDEKIESFSLEVTETSGVALNKEGKEINLNLNTIQFGENLPDKFELFQNYPNPFNPTTTIKYSIPEEGLVKLKVINILGETVKEVVNEIQERGNYKLVLNASNLASGVYIYTIEFNLNVISKKMLLLR